MRSPDPFVWFVVCIAVGAAVLGAGAVVPAGAQLGSDVGSNDSNATGVGSTGTTTPVETDDLPVPTAGTAALGAPNPANTSLPDSCAVMIESQADLEDLDEGEIGCIPGNETIEMTMSEEGTTVPENASVISNGAILRYNGTPRTDEYDRQVLLDMEDRTTLRGVEVVGPVAGREEPGADGEFGFAGRYAIRIGVEIGGQGVEVDSTTVRGWPAGGIAVEDDATATVHHSRIVGQYTGDRGYGISVSETADVYVAATYFNRNRHSMMAGDAGSYTVTDSVIGPESVSHSLDVHPPAGGRYVFSNLTVMNENGLAMRQVPNRTAVVSDVWFTQADPEDAIYQVDERECDRPGRTHCDSGTIATAEGGYEDFRNMRVEDLYFGADPPPGVGAPPSMPAPPDVPSAPVENPDGPSNPENPDDIVPGPIPIPVPSVGTALLLLGALCVLLIVVRMLDRYLTGRAGGEDRQSPSEWRER